MQSFTLGNYLVEPSKGTISDASNTVKIEPKAMAVLFELYLKKGEVVSHEVLFEKVWPGRIYSPSLLQRTIALIRKSLNESSHNSVYLFTHPKLGYRLEGVKANVEVLSSANGINWLTFIKGICLSIALLVILYWLTSKQAQSLKSDYQLLSHGMAQESNGHISPDNKWISYQSNEPLNVIQFTQLPDFAKHHTLRLEDEVIDHLWRDQNNLLVLMRTSKGKFYLSQVGMFDANNEVSSKLVDLEQYHSITQITLLDSTTLVFINNDENLAVIKWDLLTKQPIAELDIAEKAIYASLAVSSHDAFVHSFDGLQGNLTRIKQDGSIEKIDVTTPLVAHISWDQNNNSLVISDQLKAQQWRYRQNELEPYSLSETEILSQLTIHSKLIVATQTRPNMDIFMLKKGQLTPIVQSKYREHLGKINRAGKIAYTSNRRSIPQIIVKQNENETTTFDAATNSQRISSLQWSPKDDKLAYSSGNSITILDVNTAIRHDIHLPFEVNNIMSWSEGGEILFTDNQARVYELNMTQQNYTLLEQPESVDFLAKDKDAVQLGIKNNLLFWGEQQLALQAEVHFASYSNNRLIIQVKNQTQSEIKVFNNQLFNTYSMVLSDDCEFVTSAVIDNAELLALCTKVNPADKDIVLISTP